MTKLSVHHIGKRRAADLLIKTYKCEPMAAQFYTGPNEDENPRELPSVRLHRI